MSKKREKKIWVRWFWRYDVFGQRYPVYPEIADKKAGPYRPFRVKEQRKLGLHVTNWGLLKMRW